MPGANLVDALGSLHFSGYQLAGLGATVTERCDTSIWWGMKPAIQVADASEFELPPARTLTNTC